MTMTEGTRSPAHALLEVLEPAGRIAILPHDNPDPDALASALAVREIVAWKLGRKAPILQAGVIGRSENRALVDALRIPLTPAARVLRSSSGALVLVDTQPGRKNNSLPEGATVAAVIDHHPDWGETRGVPCVDLRESYGATSSILTEYLQELEMPVDAALATALFYGISSETRNLARETRAADIRASQFLYPYVDKRLLGLIENPPLSRAYFGLLSRAIQNSLLCDDVVLSLVESVPYPDAAAELADFLLRLDRVRWAICLARFRDHLYVSLRTKEPDATAGLLLASVLPSGSAGGHGMAAGGRLPLDGADWVDAALPLCTVLLEKLGRSGARVEALALPVRRPPGTRDSAIDLLRKRLPLA